MYLVLIAVNHCVGLIGVVKLIGLHNSVYPKQSYLAAGKYILKLKWLRAEIDENIFDFQVSLVVTYRP